jgi:2-keto-4-pentenoate hydratase/2-oxohepta-3-ene-1,7-dioic acid hydratase in catechol pathway
VIAKKAKNVPKERALEYVFGYSILNDVSARDVQYAETQWVRGKSFDTFAPFGPWIVTADEIPDPSGLGIRSWINNTLMQEASTADMVFGVPEIVSYLSECFTLEPGDVIATGTPGGVGHFRNPPVYLKPGDRIRIEIERIGTLENPVRSES